MIKTIKHTTYLFAVCLLCSACTGSKKTVAEIPVQLIQLESPLNHPSSQISGLDWCGEQLILLPQKPGFETTDDEAKDHYLYSIEKKSIIKHIESQASTSLAAKTIRINDHELRDSGLGFDGYEAIVCTQDKIWISIEAQDSQKNFSTKIISASIPTTENFSDGKITIADDHKKAFSVPSLSGIWNMADETLLADETSLISIHESNGNVDSPNAIKIDVTTGNQTAIAIDPIPYRITDATRLDDNKRFWVINYQYQGDRFLKHDHDWIREMYPAGETHKLEENVERLIELELTDSGIRRTETPPIYLKLSNENGRNWEGIARLNDIGFLLVSDEFPTTYFGFVPFPSNQPAAYFIR